MNEKHPARLVLSAVTILFMAAAQSCDHIVASHPNRIALPVCACILRGAGWTVIAKPSGDATLPPGEDHFFTHTESAAIANNVNSLIDSASAKIWEPQADIALVPQIDAQGYIPVIDYPNVYQGQLYGNVAAYYADGEDVAGKCRAAWGKALIPDAVVVIIVRKLTSTGGIPIPKSGYSEYYDQVNARRQGKDLCTVPRNLTKDDTKGRYILLEDPTLLGLAAQAGHGFPYIILGHEVGHVFMLGHGDGLDNNNNGTQPPGPGDRRFDEICDPDEFLHIDVPNESIPNSPISLMNETPGYFTKLTPLQMELAQTAARLMPGASGP